MLLSACARYGGKARGRFDILEFVVEVGAAILHRFCFFSPHLSRRTSLRAGEHGSSFLANTSSLSRTHERWPISLCVEGYQKRCQYHHLGAVLAAPAIPSKTVPGVSLGPEMQKISMAGSQAYGQFRGRCQRLWGGRSWADLRPRAWIAC